MIEFHDRFLTRNMYTVDNLKLIKIKRIQLFKKAKFKRIALYKYFFKVWISESSSFKITNFYIFNI